VSSAWHGRAGKLAVVTLIGHVLIRVAVLLPSEPYD
jgi:hypothetical protein